jgi:hypothetical protein
MEPAMEISSKSVTSPLNPCPRISVQIIVYQVGIGFQSDNITFICTLLSFSNPSSKFMQMFAFAFIEKENTGEDFVSRLLS